MRDNIDVMLRESANLEPSEWIASVTDTIETDRQLFRGNFVSHCVPRIFPAYCKIFHPVFEDLSVSDRTISWNDLEEKGDVSDPVDNLLSTSVTVYGGEYDAAALRRLRWSDLATQRGLTFHPEINEDTFTRNFPGRSWPRYLIGPEEGQLDDDACHRIVRHISSLFRNPDCLFLYDLIATADWESDLLFEGELQDVFAAREVEGVNSSPNRWWPEDRTWFIHTDYDLTFTLIGGESELIDALLSDDQLECIRVEPDHRIDYRADTINP